MLYERIAVKMIIFLRPVFISRGNEEERGNTIEIYDVFLFSLLLFGPRCGLFLCNLPKIENEVSNSLKVVLFIGLNWSRHRYCIGQFT